MKKNIFYLILFLFFLFIFSLFYKGLDNPNIYTTEKIKNKNLSAFTSKELFSNKQFDSNDIIKVNKFTIINIWSSWCIPCKQEHSVLMDLKEKTNINIIGLNYKDKKNNAINFINKLGNPFSKILIDPDGVISISLGAYGVPETFLLNSESKVIRKYIGPLTYDNILEIINLIKS
tara:strand:+ start:397 stop:921 length:525 start_codon:yes stop_codon:yes gene_type:complete